MLKRLAFSIRGIDRLTLRFPSDQQPLRWPNKIVANSTRMGGFVRLPLYGGKGINVELRCLRTTPKRSDLRRSASFFRVGVYEFKTFSGIQLRARIDL